MNSMSQPTNAVLAAKLDGLRELIDERADADEKMHNTTNKHLEILNGQVAKNTEFRIGATVKFSIIVFAATTVATAIATLTVQKFF